MHMARIVTFSEVKVGDSVCKKLEDVRSNITYNVLEIIAGEDKKGPLVSLRLQREGPFIPSSFLYNSDPDDLIILVERPQCSRQFIDKHLTP